MKPSSNEKSRMLRLSREQDLRPWSSVAQEWNRRSGENLSDQHVCVIGRRAGRKLRTALARLAADMGLRVAGGGKR